MAFWVQQNGMKGQRKMTVIDTTPAPLLLAIAAIAWTAIGVYLWVWFNSFDDTGSN